MARSYRDLLIWQKGIQLTVLVYQLSKTFPREDLYGLTSQMRRAAVSIPSNIAEGAGRLNTPEFRQFLGIARGSSFELQTQLTIAKELGFGLKRGHLWEMVAYPRSFRARIGYNV